MIRGISDAHMLGNRHEGADAAVGISFRKRPQPIVFKLITYHSPETCASLHAPCADRPDRGLSFFEYFQKDDNDGRAQDERAPVPGAPAHQAGGDGSALA